ncbi:MAG: glycosyltransferase family 2 protein, partial [Methanobacteriota archaeon]
MKKCGVTAIVPCYCCSDTIERAFYSVVNQTVLPKEVILVDDASPDHGRTLSILHGLKQKFNETLDIRILAFEKNQGPASARNAGWEAATQPFIAFLDADDSWHPRKLEVQYQW